MKRLDLLARVSVGILVWVFMLPAGQNEIKDMPEKYRVWLEEEGVYIISPGEKNVFLQLQTDRERDIFIEAFWRVRDPNPATPENEFKKEHYHRLRYANRILGRGTPTPGWRTDKGRIYIILGEPQEITNYEYNNQLIPTEVWFYQGKTDMGLPSAFNLVFIRKEGAGDWKLYSPIKDGPRTLLRFHRQDRFDIAATYKELLSIDPNLAEVAVNLIPMSRTNFFNPSMASEVLVSRIFEAPKKVKDEYAEKLLKYRDIIEVEYSAKYIGNDFLVQVIQDEPGKFFVHYLLEPKKLSIEKYEDTYHTNLDINGKITSSQGRTIYQFSRKLSLEFTEDQLNQIRAKLYSYQDIFPLIEGNYTFDLLMKNNISKEFTSFEIQINIPASSQFQMSPLLLAQSRQDSPYTKQIKAFKVGGHQLYASPRHDFSKNDELYVFTELYRVPDEIKNTGKIQWTLFKDETEISVFHKALSGTILPGYKYLEQFKLESLSPGNYKVRVSVLDKKDKELLFEQAFFFISHRMTLPRPFIHTNLLVPGNDCVYDYIRGTQYFNKGQIQKARMLLELAYHREPQKFEYAQGYAQVLFPQKQFQKVIDILSPFIRGEEKQHNAYALVGNSCQSLGRYSQAIEYYKSYLTQFGTHLEILNSLGECCCLSGNRQEALAVWKKSLELDANQKEIMAKVKTLEKEEK